MRGKTQHDMWPTQPSPTDDQWVIWQNFILRCYISDGQTQFNTILTPDNSKMETTDI